MKRTALILAAFVLTACGQRDMDAQAKYKPYRPSALFANGAASQAPPPGAVARGDLEREAALTARPPMTIALLKRGQERYDIYCAPCHGKLGDGDGPVVQRGFPRPASFEDPRLLAASDEHFLDVIENGYGAMYAHGDRVAPPDRWAIVAYIHALRLSQDVALNALPAPLQSAARKNLR